MRTLQTVEPNFTVTMQSNDSVIVNGKFVPAAVVTVPMCVCVCTHARMHACVCIHMCISARAHTHTHTLACMYR